jgi:hypothetical protein
MHNAPSRRGWHDAPADHLARGKDPRGQSCRHLHASVHIGPTPGLLSGDFRRDGGERHEGEDDRPLPEGPA